MTTHPSTEPAVVDLRVPWVTILKMLLVILLVAMAIRLFPFALMVLLSVLLAVALHPVVVMLRNRRVPHGLAVSIVAAGLFAIVVGLLWLIIPAMIAQGAALVKSLPELQDRLHSWLPRDGMFRVLSDQANGDTMLPDPSTILKQAVSWGGWAVEGITEIGLVLIVSIYLVLDGERTYEWLLPYLPRKHRGKMGETAKEVSAVIFAYMAGQFITSALCTVYLAVVLTILHVPAALILAVLAGVLDILPVLGFFLSIIPAMLLGLTVSPMTGLLVAGAYVFYHVVENYLIVPKVYGNRLRLSTLTVLLAVLVGGIVAGIPGAIAVLPVVASYPIIERIWLKNFLGREVVAEHAREAEPPKPSPAPLLQPPPPG